MNINFDEALVTWKGKEMPMHPRNCFQNNQLIWKTLSDEPHSTAEACANTIVHEDAATKCNETDLRELVANQVQSTTISLLKMRSQSSESDYGPSKDI